MVEPISIITGVVSLTSASVKIGGDLLVLRSRFQRAPQAVIALSNEIELTRAGLGTLETLLRSRERVLSGADPTKAHILRCLDSTTVAIAKSFSALDAEIGKLNGARGTGGNGAGGSAGGDGAVAVDTDSTRWRLRFMWVQSDLKTLAGQMRDQRSGLEFLMNCVQMTKLDEIQRQFETTSPGLSALRRTATIARDSRPGPARTNATATGPTTNGPAYSNPALQNILSRDGIFPDLDQLRSVPSQQQASTNLDPNRIPNTNNIRSSSRPTSPRPTSPQPQQPPRPQSQPQFSTSPSTTPTANGFNTNNESMPPPRQTGQFPAMPYTPSSRVLPTMVHHELHYAVANADIARIPSLLDLGFSPLGFPIDPYGNLPNNKKTALALAAFLGRDEILRMFLEHGFAWSVNECIGSDLPPLHAAAYAGHEICLKHLLHAGANPRLRGPGNCTALFWAAARGHRRIIEILLDLDGRAGTHDDVDFPNDKSLTPLMVAAQHGHHDVVKLLLEHGADVHARNTKGQNALHLAAHGGRYEVTEILLAHASKIKGSPKAGGKSSPMPSMVNGTTANGKTPLMFASAAGWFDVVDLLAASGALINLQDADGRTALYHAAAAGKAEAVEVLLDRYASTESVAKRGDRALHAASDAGHAKVVGLLLDHGARLEATRDEDGLAALDIARKRGHRELIGPLLLFRMEQDPANFGTQAALYAAAEWGLGETMDALLEAGADVNGSFTDGEDEEEEVREVEEQMDEGRRKGMNLLVKAVRERNVEAATALIEKGARVNGVDAYGTTLLHRAARTSDLAMAGVLLRAGARVDAIDRNGFTPLQVAETFADPAMVGLLTEFQWRSY